MIMVSFSSTHLPTIHPHGVWMVVHSFGLLGVIGNDVNSQFNAFASD